MIPEINRELDNRRQRYLFYNPLSRLVCIRKWHSTFSKALHCVTSSTSLFESSFKYFSIQNICFGIQSSENDPPCPARALKTLKLCKHWVLRILCLRRSFVWENTFSLACNLKSYFASERSAANIVQVKKYWFNLKSGTLNILHFRNRCAVNNLECLPLRRALR